MRFMKHWLETHSHDLSQSVGLGRAVEDRAVVELDVARETVCRPMFQKSVYDVSCRHFRHGKRPREAAVCRDDIQHVDAPISAFQPQIFDEIHAVRLGVPVVDFWQIPARRAWLAHERGKI